ncbi:hypothetical protein FSARC_8518 [Fusarium sarcochroum]|uniref:Heterokaryon incompatibility domain-containing protein n=1 Tax=Fusarium sarcochroum TaxID=1208366 RepID=A0A8H4X740_9HYPO|nr:hypothetical protein FSARC_8518 [Fusarium sarcochroum]
MASSPEDPSKQPLFVSDCAICKDIWRIFTDDDLTRKVEFGPMKEALSTQCPNHKPLVQEFIDRCWEDEDETEWSEIKMELNRSYSCDKHTVHINGERVDGSPSFIVPIVLVNNSAHNDHPGYGRILDPDWVGLDIVTHWKDKCLSSHVQCQNPLKIWQMQPAWLIDVAQKCIVSGNVQERFVALSYTYGGNKQHFIDFETLDRLQKPGALDMSELSKYVAPIIRHAMYLTTVLGERYLWADALCIFHHERESTAQQLRSMGAIYANAVVTIVATDGDSESGLLGLEGVSDARQLEQTIVPFGADKIAIRNAITSNRFHFDPDGIGEYNQRGWTYQEYRMAKRRIIFKNKELHWECDCSVWHEDMVSYTKSKQEPNQFFHSMTAGLPNYYHMNRITVGYNDTTLRYDEDALPAASGMLSILSRSFLGGFLFGIPEMFFDQGLGWQAYFSSTDLRRRIPSGRPLQDQLPPCDLPSWSWIGWQGLVNTDGYEAIGVLEYGDRLQETIPITEWYTSLSPLDPPAERRRIRSTWYENRNKYKDLTRSLPEGWTRHDAPKNPRDAQQPVIHPDGCGKYVFKHERAPNDMYWYPFPTADIQESTLPFTPAQTAYLFCETNKARLSGYLSGDYNDVKLYNDSKEEVGMLRLANEEQQTFFPESRVDNGYPIDVVAISKVKKYDQPFDKIKGKHVNPWNTYYTYIVLWVEWKDGVAYRLARGEVKAVFWDKLNLDKVSLVLG